MDQLKFHDMLISFLPATRFKVDAGSTFGPVAKAVWSKLVEVDDLDRMDSVTSPMLIQYQAVNYLIDTGHGTSKMSEKSKNITGLKEETQLFNSLKALNLQAEDIDYILMTHMHDDHAGGLTKREGEHIVSSFPNAKIIVSQKEWEAVQHPNLRTRGTYLEDNWRPVRDQVHTFNETMELAPGLKMICTGGHSPGHSIILLEQAGETLIHLADHLQSPLQAKPQWVTGFDDYPMDVLESKKYWLDQALPNGWGCLLYHDPNYTMVKLDPDSLAVIDHQARTLKS
ncbi:MBL fold metallo-hydrolase [Hutsoniella sourekii]|uniref:MBL fold metallo-hydrolase n=1 Tax=Hutsoniella sourekii TaxID=87650 RepID=UPI000488FBB7|nr:MBL fold metallo-hydrolase [Hutsoniella sourekii]